MANTYKDMACIIGVGETAYTRGTEKTSLELQLEAIVAACDDAGISPKEIDGYVGDASTAYRPRLPHGAWPLPCPGALPSCAWRWPRRGRP